MSFGKDYEHVLRSRYSSQSWGACNWNTLVDDRLMLIWLMISLCGGFGDRGFKSYQGIVEQYNSRGD